MWCYSIGRKEDHLNIADYSRYLTLYSVVILDRCQLVQLSQTCDHFISHCPVWVLHGYIFRVTRMESFESLVDLEWWNHPQECFLQKPGSIFDTLIVWHSLWYAWTANLGIVALQGPLVERMILCFDYLHQNRTMPS